MKLELQPLVTVLIPVYNGEKFLAECIESILAQQYEIWELIIVNNCSTDQTLEIAQKYAKKDQRIQIYNNQSFVDVIENHNIAFQQLSLESDYCKLVQADDWLFPECFSRMIEVAESHASVGVVGSYCLAGSRVKCDGLPYPSHMVSGHEICGKTLLGHIYPFLSPSSLLVRSSIVREQTPFYKTSYLHADLDAMYRTLYDHDFGFVHQVLSYIRTHSESMTSRDAMKISTQRLSHLNLLIKYGRVYLDEKTYSESYAELLEKHYKWLAQCFFELRGKDFWQYQKSALRNLGSPLNLYKLIGIVFSELLTKPRLSARLIKKAISQNRNPAS